MFDNENKINNVLLATNSNEINLDETMNQDAVTLFDNILLLGVTM